MMRSIALAALLALSGCGEDRPGSLPGSGAGSMPGSGAGSMPGSGAGGSFQIARAAIGQVWGSLFGQDDAPPPAGVQLTRAQVDADNVALIRARLLKDPAPTLLRAATANGGYVTFASQFNQTLTLRGSLITASRGLGEDLLSVQTTANDPLIRPTPLANWPERVTRIYHLPGVGPEGREVRVTCRFEIDEALSIEIVEVTHVGTRVSEYCSGSGVVFENMHFVANGDGFVWRSRQWLGPFQGLVDLEVIEPLTAG